MIYSQGIFTTLDRLVETQFAGKRISKTQSAGGLIAKKHVRLVANLVYKASENS